MHARGPNRSRHEGESAGCATKGGVVENVRIALVDDQPLVRKGLRALLEAEGFQVVVEAGTAEALELVKQEAPQVVVLDPGPTGDRLPGLCDEIRRGAPAAAMVVLAARSSAGSVHAAVDAGARAYVHKHADVDLPRLIERVLSGETVYDDQALQALSAANADAAERPALSEREIDVLHLVREGLTNAQIGGRLYLSRHTVKEYLSDAMRKLDATNRVDAVLRATRLGLFDGDEQALDAPFDQRLHALVVTRVETGSGGVLNGVRDQDISVEPIKIRAVTTSKSDIDPASPPALPNEPDPDPEEGLPERLRAYSAGSCPPEIP